MATIKELKTNFVGGEQSPLLRARSDVKAYYNGAERLRNVVVLPQGGARTRPGTRFVWEVPEVSPGVLSEVRMFEFQFSTEQTYLFVFHHLAVTIFRDGVEQATVVTPWASSELRATFTAKGDLISTGINVTQSRDTMLVFHQDKQTRQIKRMGSHVLWGISLYPYKNLARFDFGDTAYVNGVDEVQSVNFPAPGAGGNWANGDTFKLILEDEKTDNIQVVATVAGMATNVQTALRKLPNVDAAGITVTTTAGAFPLIVTFSGGNGERPWGSMAYETVSTAQSPSIEIIVTTDGERPGEDMWSDARGWPRCGVFFGGRLWVAGTKSLPNSTWASRAGAQTDFNAKKIDADYGISATTDTDDVPAFINIFAGRHLQFFSTAAEFYIPISESDAVTPENIVLRRTTSRGSKAGLRVFEVDGATLFVQRRGKALREFIFADVELAYQANNISLLADHLMRDPVGLALRRSSSTEDADYLFMPNGDGTMTTFCTLRTQEVNAMTLWETQGLFDDVAVVLEDVYFSVIRTIDGDQRKYIEVMDETIAIDCAVSDLDLGAPATGVTLAHLPNTLIEYEVDSFVRQPVTSNGAGAIVFDMEAETSYVAGLKFPEVLPEEAPGFIWGIITLPFETQLPDGASMGRKRRVVNADVRVYETTALIVNGTEIAF
ncbi:MAG TPA: hypothetical protein VJM50_11085, partial [Pyrinomonadaceae bacterium]|nr:hypothetical protein [Pyrinomonadaceae bacterium]